MQGNTAVQLRAARIGGEYQRTAIKVDQELGVGGMVCARPLFDVSLSLFYSFVILIEISFNQGLYTT